MKASPALSSIKRAHELAVFGRRARVLSEALATRIPPDATVLDIGCGDGTIASLIQRRASSAQIKGIEFAPRPNCLIECQTFNGVIIPYPSASFDVCMLVDVLHHTNNIGQLLSEACRVSRRFVLLKDHLSRGWLDFKTLQFMDWVGNRPHGVVLPYNYQSSSQWNEFFSAAGLAVRDWQEHLPLYPFPFSRIFGRRLHYLALLEKA